MPIETVLDPVFAQKMVRDGISIDPISNTLRAPCDGEIIQIHPSHHAMTLKTPEGVEILMHVGLDMVELRGEGFLPQVKLDDHVTPGAALLEFDIDYVALHAKSLLTQIVVKNTECIAEFIFQQGLVNVGQDIFLELMLAANGVAQETTTGEIVISEPIVKRMFNA